jgi:glucokinase
MILAGDIGATKTHLAIFSTDRGPLSPITEASFPSSQFADLEQMVSEFLAQVKLTVDRASFGVAGPVVDGKAQITNLAWSLSEDHLAESLNLVSVKLINDLVATASAVPLLRPDDLLMLNKGQAIPKGTIGVLAPGTGLGQAFLVWDGKDYQAYPSEGGHTDFGPTSNLEIQLLQYLWRTYDHVSYERICSGIGIPNIYSFLKDSSIAEEPEWFREQLAAADDPTPIIVNNALDPQRACALSSKTLQLFVSILGAEASNLALKVLATGGIYLGGGIPPRILPSLKQDQFLKSFLRKGRFESLLQKVPVQVILNPNAAIIGAAYYGLMS